MNKKKKITLIVLAIIALIIIIAAGYTFSKYYQAINGSASTQIAAWSFKANAGENNESVTDIVLKNGTEEKIAPGSKGTFKIKVDSLGSDVDVKYHVDVKKETLPSNMIFYIVGEEEEFYTSLDEFAKAKLTGTLLKDGSQSKVYNIGWEWPFETVDEITNILLDSADLLAATSKAEYGFQVEIIGEQLDVNNS